MRKYIINLILIIVYSILYHFNLYATNYYVKTNGNDANTGLDWTQAWQTINYAGSRAKASNIVFISNGVYYEQINVSNSGSPGKYIIFKPVTSKEVTINAIGSNYGFNLNNKSYIKISDLIIKNADDTGIYINEGDYNIITNCHILSNMQSGIYLNNGANYNILCTNQIYGNNQDYGILINNCKNNRLSFNNINYHDESGVYLINTSISNFIIRNNIYFNDTHGIYFNSSTANNNYIISNNIWGNIQNFGIYLLNAYSTFIYNNQITGNQSRGISLYSSDNTKIYYNNINNNNTYGIYFQYSDCDASFNNITNQNYGIYLNNSTLLDLHHNNLNNNWNYSLYSTTPILTKITNNWWGTTVANGIYTNTYNVSDYSNFTPYRLYGPFDLNADADIIPPSPITNVMANITASTVELIWTKCTNSDFIRYSVYRDSVPGTTNLQRSLVITNIYDVNVTNIIDSFYHGDYYYTVTALDNKYQFTNESWYSSQVSASFKHYNKKYYVKTNGNNSLSGTNWVEAWETIDYAASWAVESNIVYISNGVYSEQINPQYSGSPGRYITFKPVNPHQVIINAQGYLNGFNLTNKSYIKIPDFIIKGATNAGIYLYGSSRYNIISNNQIFSNKYNGISLNGDFVNNNILMENHLYGGNQDNGIKLTNADNNIISQSNVIYANEEYGIYYNGTSQFNIISNNIVYSNGYHGIYFNGYSVNNNKIKKNKIFKHNNDTDTGIRIDYGNYNTIGQSNIIHNNDYGIHLYNNQYIKVSNNIIYSNNKRGIFCERIQENSRFIKNKIFGPQQKYGLYFEGGSSWNNHEYNTIYSNTIYKHSETGIYCYKSFEHCNILNNTIYSNGKDGISFINWDYRNNNIENNNIYANSEYGIYFSGFYDSWQSAFYRNHIKNNDIKHNQYGIQANSYVTYSTISNNNIASNTSYGLYLTGETVDNNKIINNKIQGDNQNTGIWITNTGKVDINNNNVYDHNNTGIIINSTSNIIIENNNVFYNNKGIEFINSASSVTLNNFTNNNYGFVFQNSSDEHIQKNNLQNNNIYAFSNVLMESIKITNHWWGTTVGTNINNLTYGLSYTNFTPYRLFGPFDLAAGADRERPMIITNFMINVSESTVRISWNKCTNSDFSRYSIYRIEDNGYTNLNRSYVITNITDINITSIMDFPDHGTYYYTVTALDNKTDYTNESWYAKGSNVYVNLLTTMSIIKSISNISLSSISTNPIPGSTITYKIIYTNSGINKGKNIVIYDSLSTYVTYATQMQITANNWYFEYSTNTTPNQDYSSPDYIPGNPIEKTNIRWIRWKKPLVYQSEDGLSLVYKVVIN